ncbi:hypothetical protein PHYSODRAFT_323514 [Phytophthora sojae]|uniref:Uncharacterized protein n=1 Tax=Phytophthora sojae (strain P6497) TaxID=1094619 RepID=G4YNB1_PHYSP|nr:hypothetical protein PHYSODRAFT_323514 [Phytophthora sojae]EGZ30064.1 hypothetical protein PHYSODRAFT_323514 [Phytophthora sojae]|eukprot:XP_009517339.1 hypothetical protein PHYSODRAFT_323514 [Phytophthora sojae]
MTRRRQTTRGLFAPSDDNVDSRAKRWERREPRGRKSVGVDEAGHHLGGGHADCHHGTGVLGRYLGGTLSLHCKNRVEMDCHLQDDVVIRRRLDHQETLGPLYARRACSNCQYV